MKEVSIRRTVTELTNLLQLTLDLHFSHWGVKNIKPSGYGMEYLVFSAYSDLHGKVAIRVPWVRYFINHNDGEIDSRKLLHQEFVMSDHCYRLGMPIPKTIKLFFNERLDFLVTDFIEGDSFPVSSYEKGKIASQIHQAPLYDFKPIYQGTKKFSEVYAERIKKRTKNIERLTHVKLLLPSVKEIGEIIEYYQQKNTLLHMDIRDANLIGKNGKLKAIFDWSNALLGDPIAELMRIQEFGELDNDFLKGYHNQNLPFDKVPELIKNIYSFDAAVMLAIVFLSSLPDPEKGEAWLNRVINLHKKIKKEWA